MTVSLEAKDVSVRFGGLQALDSVEVEVGELVAVPVAVGGLVAVWVRVAVPVPVGVAVLLPLQSKTRSSK